jgi:hypothetical protein
MKLLHFIHYFADKSQGFVNGTVALVLMLKKIKLIQGRMGTRQIYM